MLALLAKAEIQSWRNTWAHTFVGVTGGLLRVSLAGILDTARLRNFLVIVWLSYISISACGSWLFDGVRIRTLVQQIVRRLRY